ncbi:MAG: hypothetical protein JWM91_5471 [Rhodospirillales bacterium]|nr:hypothetical protein [Rhodospirillales bacterium]
MDKKQYAEAGANSPLATEDQKAVERIALRLLKEPAVQTMIADTAREIKTMVPHGPLTAAIFDYEFEQMRFIGLEAAINIDANYPRIHAVSLYPHQTDGIDIPGTKGLHPSPDYVYRLAPVDDSARFVVRGRKPPGGPLAFEVSLIGANEATQGNLSISDLAIAPDGGFTITVDPNEAGGRPNHLQSAPGAQQLIIRDIFDDIAVQRPMALTIERLDPPRRPALTIEEIIAGVPKQMTKAIRGTMAVTNAIKGAPNALKQPAFFNQGETLVTQAYSMGHFKLTEDQAFVIRMTMGSAGYAIVPATNYWGGIGDFLNHRTCISSGQAVPNPDGSYTYVVARKDPGVANWVETDGLDEGMLCVRWTAFGQNEGPMPTLEAKLVTLADIESALPPGTPRYDAAARQERIAKHARDYSSWSRG